MVEFKGRVIIACMQPHVQLLLVLVYIMITENVILG